MKTPTTKTIENTFYADNQTLTSANEAVDLDSMLSECVDYFIQSEYQLALPYTLSLMDAYQRIQDKEQVLNTFFLLTLIYEQVGDFPTTFEILPFVIEQLAKLPVSDATVKAQSAIGRLYFLLGDFDLAITYYSKALENQSQLETGNNLAMIYKYQAEAYFSKREYQSAKENAEKSLQFCNNHTQPFLQASCLNCLGTILHQMGLENAAIRKYKAALKILEQNPNPYEKICAFKNIGKWYAENQEKDNGLLFMVRAYDLAKKYGTRVKRIEILLELANTHKQYHSYQLAAEFFERYIIEKENLSLLPFASQLRHLETAQKIEIINRRNHQLRREIQEKIQNQAELEVLATTDPLTGLFNRRHFFTLTEHWCENALKVPFEISAMMIDIDHFKQVNDQYGHQAGDQALVKVARAIQAALRTDDVLCRYGGEEFCVLLPNTNLSSAFQVGERIRNKIENLEINFEKQIIRLTVSLGIADLANSPKLSVMGLLGHADQALYDAKHKGRNCCIIFNKHE